ncbi:MAG: hypothetical protein ACTSYI_16430 [Promethearchaeota archaeon]
MSKTTTKRAHTVFSMYNVSQDVLMIDYEGRLHGFIAEEEEENYEIAQMIENTLHPSLI